MMVTSGERKSKKRSCQNKEPVFRMVGHTPGQLRVRKEGKGEHRKRENTKK